jgi:hypothetical protein
LRVGGLRKRLPTPCTREIEWLVAGADPLPAPSWRVSRRIVVEPPSLAAVGAEGARRIWREGAVLAARVWSTAAAAAGGA